MLRLLSSISESARLTVELFEIKKLLSKNMAENNLL